jgi:hypothetical protein
MYKELSNVIKKTFELTYGSMFKPPEELHTRYGAALEKTKSELGKNMPCTSMGKTISQSTNLKNNHL